MTKNCLGYNIYDNPNYVSWLTKNHPEAVPALHGSADPPSREDLEVPGSLADLFSQMHHHVNHWLLALKVTPPNQRRVQFLTIALPRLYPLMDHRLFPLLALFSPILLLRVLYHLRQPGPSTLSTTPIDLSSLSSASASSCSSSTKTPLTSDMISKYLVQYVEVTPKSRKTDALRVTGARALTSA